LRTELNEPPRSSDARIKVIGRTNRVRIPAVRAFAGGRWNRMTRDEHQLIDGGSVEVELQVIRVTAGLSFS
jgi:hypothetical protein